MGFTKNNRMQKKFNTSGVGDSNRTRPLVKSNNCTVHDEFHPCQLWHYGTSLLSSPRVNSDYDCHDFNRWLSHPLQKSGREKQLILLLGGFHSNPSHHTAPWADNPSGEQKHLERERDGNLTGIIVLKFEAGTTGDLVLSCTWIKNRIFCYVT